MMLVLLPFMVLQRSSWVQRGSRKSSLEGVSAASKPSQQVDRGAHGGVFAVAARQAGVELRMHGLKGELDAPPELEDHRAAIGGDVFLERRRVRREGGVVVGAGLGEHA